MTTSELSLRLAHAYDELLIAVNNSSSVPARARAQSVLARFSNDFGFMSPAEQEKLAIEALNLADLLTSSVFAQIAAEPDAKRAVDAARANVEQLGRRAGHVGYWLANDRTPSQLADKLGELNTAIVSRHAAAINDLFSAHLRHIGEAEDFVKRIRRYIDRFEEDAIEIERAYREASASVIQDMLRNVEEYDAEGFRLDVALEHDMARALRDALPDLDLAYRQLDYADEHLELARARRDELFEYVARISDEDPA